MATSTIPLSRFNIRFAKIGVHLRLHDCEPVSFMIDCETIANILKQFSSQLNGAMPKFGNFEAAREELRYRIIEAQKENDQGMIDSICLIMLSLILTMPEQADIMRKSALDAYAAGHREYYYTVACNEHIAYVLMCGTQIADEKHLMQTLEVATHSKEHVIADRNETRSFPVDRAIRPLRLH